MRTSKPHGLSAHLTTIYEQTHAGQILWKKVMLSLYFVQFCNELLTLVCRLDKITVSKAQVLQFVSFLASMNHEIVYHVS